MKRTIPIFVITFAVVLIAYGAHLAHTREPLAQDLAAQKSKGSQVTTGELLVDFKDSKQGQENLAQGDAPPSPQGMQIKSAANQATFVSEVIEAPIPFESLAPKWVADLPEGSSLLIKVRGSPDGSQWSDWRTVTVNDDMTGGEPDETFGNILFFERATKFIQYSIKLSRWKGAESPNLQQVKFFFVDAGEVPNEPTSEYAK